MHRDTGMLAACDSRAGNVWHFDVTSTEVTCGQHAMRRLGQAARLPRHVPCH